MKSKPAADIDAYIDGFPPDVRAKLQQVRDVIRKAAPGSSEAVKYGIPTFVLNGNLVHFAGYARHIGFYPAPSAIKAFEAQLASYKRSKGAVQFPLDQPIPYALIKKMVAFRAKESRAKSGLAKRKRDERDESASANGVCPERLMTKRFVEASWMAIDGGNTVHLANIYLDSPLKLQDNTA